MQHPFFHFSFSFGCGQETKGPRPSAIFLSKTFPCPIATCQKVLPVPGLSFFLPRNLAGNMKEIRKFGNLLEHVWRETGGL
jgi:hypothetical protein